MSETSDTNNSAGGPSRGALIIGIVVIVAALVGALVFFTGDDDNDSAATTVESTVDATTVASTEVAVTEPPATDAPTTDPPATNTPTTEPTTPSTIPDQTRDAIWPWEDTSTRFDDPVAAATSFAVDYLGFTDPVVGDFQAGDARSGEVTIQARAIGPTTVVVVRQLTDDDSWWVLGAAAENITLDTPTQGTVVASPLALTGSASAFEGTVEVELRADDNGEPIATSFVTGSGGPEPGPFDGSVEFTSPGPVGGALVLISRSPEDGGPVIEATALRVFFE